MRRFHAAGAVTALLLSAGLLHAAEPPADESPSPPWYKRMFGSKPKPADNKPETPAADKAPTRDDVKRSLDQEQKVYLQRLEFCSRLRQIAAQTNDDELLRKADNLEQQATDVYLKRTQTLPAILQDVKVAEAALDQKRESAATGSAANRSNASRAPNGRPLIRE
jgi:hypothetical protein